MRVEGPAMGMEARGQVAMRQRCSFLQSFSNLSATFL